MKEHGKEVDVQVLLRRLALRKNILAKTQQLAQQLGGAPKEIIEHAVRMVKETEADVMALIAGGVDLPMIETEAARQALYVECQEQARNLIEEGRPGEILREIEYMLIELLGQCIKSSGRLDEYDQAFDAADVDSIERIQYEAGGPFPKLQDLLIKFQFYLTSEIAKLYYQLHLFEKELRKNLNFFKGGEEKDGNPNFPTGG